jgi:hypothetical protein
MGMKRVIVRIDRLVLKGFGQADHDLIGADLQSELARLLADPEGVEQLASLGYVPSIRAEKGHVDQPVRGGISAARAIARMRAR